METHLFVIAFAIIVCGIYERLEDWDDDHFIIRMLDFLMTFSGFLFFNSLVFYLFTFIEIEFYQEINEICIPVFALNYSSFYFFAYLLLISMFIFIGFAAVCAYFAVERKKKNMEKDMKHIFEKIYLDPQAIKNFYIKYGE